MKFHPSNLIKLILLSFLIFLSTSCNKDSDLLVEYVVEKPKNIILNDIVIATLANQAITIEPIDKKTYPEPDKVIITEVTVPKLGSVAIQKNNTLIYTPKADKSGADTFNYTTSITNPDKTVSTQTGNVLVNIAGEGDTNKTEEEDGEESDITLNADVTYWKNAFDKEWIANSGPDAFVLSKSANRNQEYYFLSHYIDGLTSIWRATGDNSYLDTALLLIENTMKDAKVVGKEYAGWPASDGAEYSLWDGFYWRHVATLLRVMHNSPELRGTGNYQKSYDELLFFSEKNIWDRYEANGLGNFYRVNTHMSSHWARIGMELYIITGKQKYKEVFDNISFGKMMERPSNLRNQFYNNPKNPKAYTWSYSWGAARGTKVQDCSHAGAIISFLVNAYENNLYWDKKDIDALTATLDEVVFPNGTSRSLKNVDGSGGHDLPGRIHEWLPLARFDPVLQDKLKKQYTRANLAYFGAQPLGILALNTRILLDGKGVYPEKQ